MISVFTSSCPSQYTCTFTCTWVRKLQYINTVFWREGVLEDLIITFPSKRLYHWAFLFIVKPWEAIPYTLLLVWLTVHVIVQLHCNMEQFSKISRPKIPDHFSKISCQLNHIKFCFIYKSCMLVNILFFITLWTVKYCMKMKPSSKDSSQLCWHQRYLIIVRKKISSTASLNPHACLRFLVLASRVADQVTWTWRHEDLVSRIEFRLSTYMYFWAQLYMYKSD